MISPEALAQALPGDEVHIVTDTYTEPFWQRAREGVLTACQCAHCHHFRMPPTPFCPECQSSDVKWPELSGRGTVFSFTVVHGYPGLSAITLVPVVVDLEGAPGARLISNVVGVDPSSVAIGMRVEVTFDDIADGWRRPLFKPVR